MGDISELLRLNPKAVSRGDLETVCNRFGTLELTGRVMKCLP